MRGKNKIKQLTNAIIPEEQGVLFPEELTTLYEERNKLLIARYYFYLTEKKIYGEILLALSKEFYISTGRIADILAAKEDDIKQLRQTQPKKEWYRLNWAHFVW